MGTNETSRGYRYPDGNEPPALDVLLGNLAEDVNADVDAYFSDSDEAGSGTAFTFAAGFADLNVSGWTGLTVRKVGKLVRVYGAVAFSGSYTAGQTIATLVPGLRPTRQIQGVKCQVTTAGLLRTDAAGSGNISLDATFFTA